MRMPTNTVEVESKGRALAMLRNPWVFPVVLLLIGVAAHGLLIPYLGFYWNDWEGVYFQELESPAVGFQYYSERPLSALVFLALSPLTRSTPAAWHVVSLLLRWSGLLAIYYTLNQIWPQGASRHRWIVALMFVFPGYTLQPVAVAFSPHYVTFALYGLSLLLMVIALKKKGAFSLAMLLALVLGAIQIFSMEYFVGLELIRPLLIWWILQSKGERDGRKLIKKTALYWSPFLLLMFVYLWWRLLILPSALDDDPNSPTLLIIILSDPVNGLVRLGSGVLRDAGHLMFEVWVDALSNPAIGNFRARSGLFSLVVGALTAIAFTLYLRISVKGVSNGKGSSLRSLALLGASALLVGGLPVWMSGRLLTHGKWSDRFALSTMLGAVILAVCLMEWLLRSRSRMQWVLAVLLGFSITTHVYSANKYRLDWDFQRKLYWELAWRIPELKEGTVIYGPGTFTGKSSYYDGTYVMNLLFDPDLPVKARYAYFDRGHFPQAQLMSAGPMIQIHRGGQFVGHTSQVVSIYFGRSGACARVLDEVYMDDPIYPHPVSDLGLFTNPDQILDSSKPAAINPAIFGEELLHGWCYYFEKADLARQLSDWQAVLSIEATASTLDLEPAQGAEYIPFIEAHARTGRWLQALELSRRALELSPGLEATLCFNWQRFRNIELGAERLSTVQTVESEICSQVQR